MGHSRLHSVLENISWRLWYREMAAAQSYRLLTPDTSSLTPLETGKDFPFYAPDHPPTADSPSYGAGLYNQPLLAPPPSDRSSDTSSSPGSNLSISISRLGQTPSVGKFLVNMLPNSVIERIRSPSAGIGPLLSPLSASRAHTYMTLPAGCLPSTPPTSGSAPRVIAVNPTPQPTPPATLIITHPNPVVRGNQLPSTHLMIMPASQTATRPDALKAPGSGLFLQNSPERISPTDINRLDAHAVQVIAASDTMEASSGGSSQMHMKSSAEAKALVVKKRKGRGAVRHVVRPAMRKGGPVRRQSSNHSRANRPTLNIGSSSSHGTKAGKDILQPMTKALTPSPPPLPPPVAQVKAPVSKKQTVNPVKPDVTQKTNGRRVVVASSASESDFETDSDDDSWCSEEASAVEEPTKENKEEISLREAALEAQRQRVMFAKVPKCSYSNLDRSRSGLLSQLLNPDPTIFPPNHPYRTSHSTQDMTQLPRRGNTLSGLSALAPLSTSKSSAALPQAVQATMHPPANSPSGITEAMGKARIDGGYQPKGRPQQDMEMDTDSEDDNPEDKIQVSNSIAQERLAALAGRRSIDKGQPKPQAPGPSRPHLTSIMSAPIPVGHPYNLPAPSAPSTPRTTRRQMLATELSESLRRDLLWERQVSRNVMGQRRQHATALSGNGLRPMTTLPEATRHANTPPNNGASHKSLEKTESKRRAMARHRSWADDYHYSGCYDSDFTYAPRAF
ncbi:hypothetical protein HWV62_21304 [Athelia sp. TMB]|nr:hypothetical protein HWV62_21304 [Athelia sp. TMB]